MLRYTLGYYGLAYATILGTSSVFLAVAVVSRTSTAAIGLGMGYLLVSLAYPVLFELANRVLAWDLPSKLKFLSLTEIQHSGIAVMLGDAQALPSGDLGLWMTGILAGSTAVFLAGAGLLFTKPDRWT
ncbi:hypothetical protein N6H14_01495 [Paenibacillus sp. CC-CFT747]|nr:hypothetical protein N6H14_01495 [Paenibacillus sp. CC-CFT747]